MQVYKKPSQLIKRIVKLRSKESSTFYWKQRSLRSSWLKFFSHKNCMLIWYPINRNMYIWIALLMHQIKTKTMKVRLPAPKENNVIQSFILTSILTSSILSLSLIWVIQTEVCNKSESVCSIFKDVSVLLLTNFCVVLLKILLLTSSCWDSSRFEILHSSLSSSVSLISSGSTILLIYYLYQNINKLKIKPHLQHRCRFYLHLV